EALPVSSDFGGDLGCFFGRGPEISALTVFRGGRRLVVREPPFEGGYVARGRSAMRGSVGRPVLALLAVVAAIGIAAQPVLAARPAGWASACRGPRGSGRRRWLGLDRFRWRQRSLLPSGSLGVASRSTRHSTTRSSPTGIASRTSPRPGSSTCPMAMPRRWVR